MTMSGIGKKTECCRNCRRFVRHYVFSRMRLEDWSEAARYEIVPVSEEGGGLAGCFVPCTVGHCIYPRLKSRRETDVCEHFESKTARERDQRD